MQKRKGLNNSIGNCTLLEKLPNGIKLTTDKDVAHVTIYSSNIIRVRIFASDDEGRDFSYAVIAQPEETAVELLEEEGQVTITTKTLKLVVEKSPLRFSLYDLDGRLINADDKAFGTSRIGTEITTYKQLQDGERFLGLGEKTGNLDRRGTAYTNWNTDKFAYSTDADPIYMSIPFFIGVHSGSSYGIFFDNTHKTKFNFGASNNRFASFGAEDGEMDYYLIYGTNVREIICNYSWLTGRMELPPIWSLGLQQCRYSYYPDKEVLSIARTFREKKIPADVIYLDIHYMDEYKVFSFDPQRFPKPKEMVGELKDMDFHTVVILDPGIKVQKGYAPYGEGVLEDYFVKYPDGENYSGEVWPGWSHFPDFTNPTVRDWWGKQLSFYTDMGIDGFWNDMNEPAAWGQTLPDLIEFDYEGEKATHKKARNAYGMQMARSTQEGAQQLLDNQRPFVLNRAGYAGVQRFTASWTGDNVASDEHMLCGVRLLNSMGLSGISFTGYDVGGFAGEASADLFSKWIVLGVFSPMLRCHSMINSNSAEPWSFGEEAEEVAKNYVGLRYRLLPYIYSKFYKSTVNGTPVQRSLAIDYTHDENIYNQQYQNQYLFGDAFLVAPTVSGKDLLKVYLPGNTWYDLHSGKKICGGKHIAEVRTERFPLFIKGSSIIPMQSLIQSTKQQPTDTLELHIYKGEEKNSFVYYEDDGVTYNYQKEQFFKRTIIYWPSTNKVILSAVEGRAASKFSKVKMYLHGFDKLGSATVNSKPTDTSTEDYQYIAPVSNFDPFYKAGADDMVDKDVNVIQFENHRDEIQIEWH